MKLPQLLHEAGSALMSHQLLLSQFQCFLDRILNIICDRAAFNPNLSEALVTGFEGGLGFRAGAILTRQSYLGR